MITVETISTEELRNIINRIGEPQRPIDALILAGANAELKRREEEFNTIKNEGQY